MIKLGIVFFTSSEFIIAHDIISELEKLIKSAIDEESFATIPSHESHTAVIILKKLFESCQDYIKIEDEWINEETLRIIRSYVPPTIEIKILCSLEGARDLELDEFKREIDKIRNSSRRIEIFFVGYERSKQAPFHLRYIISKDVCYMLSQSIKDLGKSKSADIIRVQKIQKESTVEPAFDSWAMLYSEQELRKRGIMRQSLEEWLKNREK